MKKCFIAVSLILLVLTSSISVKAVDVNEDVASVNLYHAHCGSSEGSGCYTTPVYHSHVGSSSGGGCYTVPVYHSHTGSSWGGGCYTSPVYHSHSGSSSSGGGCYSHANYVTIDHYVCTVDACCSGWGATAYLCCPHGHGNKFTIDDTKQEVTSYSLNCGKSTSTVEYYNLGCGKSTSTIDRYNLGCGKTTDTIVSYDLGCGADSSTSLGVFKITRNVSGSSYTLIPSVSDASALLSDVTYTWSNGSVENCSVTANGTYTCTLSYKDNGGSATSVLSYTVSDYDTEAPIISGISVSSERTGSALSCTVNATDNIGVDSYKIESR